MLINVYENFQILNDGQKMIYMEEYLEMAFMMTRRDESIDWAMLFIQILKTDKSPCVKHEAAFNIGRLFSKSNNKDLEEIKDYVAHELCKVVENEESLVVRHEVIESMGDAGFNSLEVRKLLDKYIQNENYDLANTAQISYWQITGKEFGT